MKRHKRIQWFMLSAVVGLVAMFAGAGLALSHAASAASTVAYVEPSCAGSSLSPCYTSVSAAVAAAGSSATITTVQVAAGTYMETSQINITKALSLVGAGAGKTIIAGPLVSSGMIRYYNPNPAGNATISGLTLEGNGQNTSGVAYLLIVKDQNAADTVTITDDQFVETPTTDPAQATDFSLGLYSYHSMAALNVTNNDFSGLWQAALFEISSGKLTFSGNSVHNLAPSSYTSGGNTTSYSPFGVFDFSYTASGTPVNVTNPQVFSGNTFSNYAGSAIGAWGGYAGSGAGTMSNVTIQNNTFALSGYGDKPDAVQLTTQDNGSVNNVTISDNTFALSGTIHGIDISGSTAGVSVSHNVLAGSSPVPDAGISVTGTDATTNVNITDSEVVGFTTGLLADNLATGATVSATSSCFVNNVTAGIENGTGASISATQDWWGDATGPYNASTNVTGKGDSVGNNIIFRPFLTAPAPICAGPTTSNVVATPSSMQPGIALALSATVDDSKSGGFPISSAAARVDGGSPIALAAQDGSFDQVSEQVTAKLPAFTSAQTGNHTICVQGTDSAGNTGAPACVTVTVLAPPAPTPTPTVPPAPTPTPTHSSSGSGSASTQHAVPTPTATPMPGTPTPTVTATPAATAAPLSPANPPSVPPSTVTHQGTNGIGGFPIFLLILAIVIILAVAGTTLFLLTRRNNAQ